MKSSDSIRSRHILPIALGTLLFSGVSAAYAHHATEVGLDQTASVNGINVMCTGAGLDARHEAMMIAFPLRMEIAGKHGQYLGDQIVELSGGNIGGNEIAVYCLGPWVLFDVPAGQYTATTFAGHGGPSKTATIDVGGPDQDRVVMSFPELGGEVSPQQFAALDN